MRRRTMSAVFLGLLVLAVGFAGGCNVPASRPQPVAISQQSPVPPQIAVHPANHPVVLEACDRRVSGLGRRLVLRLIVSTRVEMDLGRTSESARELVAAICERHIERLEKGREKHFIIEYIVTLRKALGITQKEFGERFGVDKATVMRWENGSLRPSDESLAAIEEFRLEAMLHRGLRGGAQHLFWPRSKAVVEDFNALERMECESCANVIVDVVYHPSLGGSATLPRRP